VRALLIVLIVVAGACNRDDSPSADKVTPESLIPAAQAAAGLAAKARDDCRDACEQQVIVAKGGDDSARRDCLARCDARGGAPAPHEVPSSITRAAPVHAPPAVRPK